MEYVFVGQKSSKLKIDYRPCSIKLSNNMLISLIEGLNTKEFGFNTLSRVSADIRELKKMTSSLCADLYVDSGGYSIIKGDVPPSSTAKFIDCYEKYLEEEYETYDYIFSLDIPINLKYPTFNTKDNIYRFNKESLSRSVEILKKRPEIQDKWMLVYQFKLIDQYNIWEQLVNELELNNYTCNYAIGGQVGLRGMLRNMEETEEIDFSPFIALCYKCLWDYLQSKNKKSLFKLHQLGIYIKYDRFEIIFLEKLFKIYLKDLCNVEFTYDSINYMRTAQFKVKELELYSFIDNKLSLYDSILDTPKDLFELVYQEYYQYIPDELTNLSNNIDLENIDAFIALNVYSNISLDKFFNYIIEKYNLVEEMLSAPNYDQYKIKLNNTLISLGNIYPKVFTSRLIHCIKENLRLTYIFNRWFFQQRDYNSLDSLIRSFIKKIGIPWTLN